MSYLEDTVNVKEYRERRNKFTVEADRIKSILDDTVRKLQFAVSNISDYSYRQPLSYIRLKQSEQELL